MIITRIISALVLLTLLFSSCDSNRLYEENRDIKDGVWNVKDRLEFEVDVPDSVTPYNFYFNIRNTEDYPWSNIYVFMHTVFPNGKIGVDTVEFPLADQDGRWYGKGQGDIHDCQLVFKKGVRFPYPGKYKIALEHAMRVSELPGVVSAGIRIERAQ